MTENKIAGLLDGLDLFQGLSYPELECISRYMTFNTAPKGEVVFHEGDPGSYMLVLIEGRMEVSKSGDGGFHLLSYEGRGRVLGEMALLDREQRSATCVAATDCDMLTINQEGMERMAQEFPAIAYKLLFIVARLLSRRLRRTSGILTDFL
ncbi:MAG: cyclic nucleotide-binding domain-containing protein [Sulfuricella denitrificans]|nr:cyclic nucleotide-binding domain-containing protein [Sulfuricella denitrificans]